MISENTIMAGHAGIMLRSVGQDDISLEGEQSVGREHNCDIRIVDKRISRYHAKISVTRAGLMVEDLGSTNGSYVNGRRIRQATMVSLGDELSFHKTAFRVVSDRTADVDATVYGASDNAPLKAPRVTAKTSPNRVKPATREKSPPVAQSAEHSAPGCQHGRKQKSSLTAIEKQRQRQQRQDEAWLRRVADLAAGVWIEFAELKGRAYACCVLATVGGSGQQCVLVPGSGFGVIEKSCREIGIDMQRGKARVLERGPWYGRLAIFITGALRRAERAAVFS
jgi:pSer/pThr/pTyr-binding forkhead associated (FHA) protein